MRGKLKAMSNPDAIIVGDMHIRDDQPICRLDDFWTTQLRKFQWLRELWETLGQPLVLQAGDLVHRWKSSPQVISAMLKYLPPMVAIQGLPGQHNAHELEKDPLHTLLMANKGWRTGTRVLNPTRELVGGGVEVGSKLVLLAHTMILDGPAPFSGQMAKDFLRQMMEQGYSLVVTGHNHKPIIWSDPKTAINLVNPGSFTRQTADETHQPRVYLWWAEKNILEPVFVPIEDGVITRQHIATVEERNEELSAFVQSLSNRDLDLTINFKQNCLMLLSSSEVDPGVRQRAMEVLG